MAIQVIDIVQTDVTDYYVIVEEDDGEAVSRQFFKSFFTLANDTRL